MNKIPGTIENWENRVLGASAEHCKPYLDPEVYLESAELPRVGHTMTDIFVFGSNLLGIHGAGAALYAKQHHGAIQGQGEGLQGTSYAIPTKKTPYKRLNLNEIKKYINTFKIFAKAHPEYTFLVTAIGTGLAGYTTKQIFPMFNNSPNNCLFHSSWFKDDDPNDPI